VERINELKRDGLSIQAISNLTGYDRKTIRKYLLTPVARPEYASRQPAVSKLEPFKEYLEERLKAGVWNGKVLLRELRKRNYTGGYTILTDWLRPQREAAYAVAVRRFETAPGKQAQVDWGHLGWLSSERGKQQLWGFTITLGYSRRLTAEAATDQKPGTLLRMHEAAFEELGGVPEEILYDRMRTIWTGVDEQDEIIWNAAFEDFARYWGFQPRLCRPYRAQTKGKIESGVKYVGGTFCADCWDGNRATWPASMSSCGGGWRKWPTSVCTGRRTNQCSSGGNKSGRNCRRSSDVRPTRTAQKRSAKWRGTPTYRGRAAATRCHGSMPAGQCG
jgi:transposase